MFDVDAAAIDAGVEGKRGIRERKIGVVAGASCIGRGRANRQRILNDRAIGDRRRSESAAYVTSRRTGLQGRNYAARVPGQSVLARRVRRTGAIVGVEIASGARDEGGAGGPEREHAYRGRRETRHRIDRKRSRRLIEVGEQRGEFSSDGDRDGAGDCVHTGRNLVSARRKWIGRHVVGREAYGDLLHTGDGHVGERQLLGRGQYGGIRCGLHF